MVNVKVVGDEGVGKSAFVVQYCKGVFEEEIDPTIDDSYRKHVLFDGKNVIAEIHDTVSHNFYKVSLEEWISLFRNIFCLNLFINNVIFNLYGNKFKNNN